METNETEEQRFDRRVVENIIAENIEEKLYLVKLGTKPKLYGQNVFPKIKKGAVIFTDTTTTGVVPETDFELEAIVIERKQHEAVGTSAAAEKMELVTQKIITDYLTTDPAKWKQMVVTGGTASDIGNINAFTSDNTSTTKITMDNIFKARSLLVGRSVKKFGNAAGKYGKYIGLIHPDCAHTLEFDAIGNTEQGMMDLEAGAIGTKYGITFYEYPFAQLLESKGKGTPDVYPTFIIGQDAFFCLNWNVKSTYVTGADFSNPLALWKRVSVELTYNCAIRDADRIVVILSQK